MKSYKDELYHYGIKGQQHGKRRFQNEDGSLTAAGRARYGVSKGDNRHGILSVSDQRAGGGPQTKGKLSGAPAQRTTGNRNPREMGMGAARTTRNADGSTSRRTDNGDVVFERKRKDGTAEVIRQSGRGDTRTVVGRNGATRESYKVVGEDDIRNKRTERGLRGEKHEVVSGKVHDSTDHIQSHYDTSNRDRAEALKKRGHISSDLAEQYRKAREKGAAVAYVEQWQKERDKQTKAAEQERQNKRRREQDKNAGIGMNSARRMHQIGERGEHFTDRRRDDGTIVREMGKTGRTAMGNPLSITYDRNGKVVSRKSERDDLKGEKHKVLKNGKTATPTGVAAVGKTASKQLSSALSKARSMAAKEAVKKGAVVKKKKKG